jgi:hypothetical protein
MQTGAFTAELSNQRVSQLQAEVRAGRDAHQAVQSRRRNVRLSKRAASVYRRALTAVALGLLLVVGLATAALAMPQAPGPAQAATRSAHVAAHSAHAAGHVTHVVGLGSGGNGWVAVAVFFVVAALLTTLTTRSRRATA